MKYATSFLISCIIFLCGCERGKQLEGVWIFNTEINNLYINDTTDLSSDVPPMVFDFLGNGSLKITNFTKKDTMLSWSLDSDSILTIDSLQFIIKLINDSQLKLLDLSRVDTFWMLFSRPLDVELPKSVKEVSDILLSNTWSIVDSNNSSWENHFDYFNTGTMLYRYKMSRPFSFDPADELHLENLQLENWNVVKYGKFTFMYSYLDLPLGSGNMNRFNQITDINSDSYTILTHQWNKSTTTQYKIKDQRDLRNDAKETLIGNWTSNNSPDQTYGGHLPKKMIKRGYVALYEGEVSLNITNDSIEMSIPEVMPIKYSYQLSRDARSIILSIQIDNEFIHGLSYYYCDILNHTDSTLKLRLFDNSVYTGGEELPRRYLLNIIQEFKKQ